MKTNEEISGATAGEADVASVVEWASALAAMAKEGKLHQLEIEHQGHKLFLRRREQALVPVAAPQVPAPVAAPTPLDELEDDADLLPVTSEVVGVFRAGKIGQGDIVKSGQALAYVESMNLNQEIVAPRAGQVVEIIAQEGDPVEYGQALVLLAGKE